MDFITRINKVHKFESNSGSTLCGRPMLGNNYALESNKPYLVGEASQCDECQEVIGKSKAKAEKKEAIYTVNLDAAEINAQDFREFLLRNGIYYKLVPGEGNPPDQPQYCFEGTRLALEIMIIKYFFTDHEHKEDMEMLRDIKPKRSPKRRVLSLWIGLVLLLSCQSAFAMTMTGEKLMSVDAIVNIIIQAESSRNPLAVGDNGKSRGLMQISEGTWHRFAGYEDWDNAFNPKRNVAVGTKIVKSIINQYQGKATISKVIFTYNSGIYIKHSLPAKWSVRHPNKIYRQVYLADAPNNIIDY